MKKLVILLVWLLIVFVSVCNAGPFVVCDPDPLATSYLVKLNTGDEVEVPAPLKYDLTGINEGEHVIEIKAKNIWGESDPVPFEFAKELPQSPMNTRLEIED